jgi:hypothetical protein
MMESVFAMKMLFVAAVALGMLAAGSAVAGDTSSSSRAGTQVTGPAVSREVAIQTIKQVSGAAAEATRTSGDVGAER